MATKVISLNIKPGIQRDGTQFDAPVYVDGRWVRFQRGRPRKIGGYRGIFQNAADISRGMISSSADGLNYVYSGYNAGLQQWVTDDDDGVGAGPQDILFAGTILTVGTLVAGSAYTNGSYTNVTLTGGFGSNATANISVSGGIVASVALTFGGVNYVVGDVLSANAADIGGTGTGFSVTVATTNPNYTANDDILWQMDIGFDAGGSGNQTLVAHPGLNLQHIDNTRNTPVLIGDFPSGNMSKVGVFTATGSMVVGPPSVFTIPSVNALIAIGQTVAGAGVPSGTTVTNVLIGSSTTAVTLSNTVTFSGTLTLSFDNNISVSGGCVILHPYLFVYGNDGLIKNSSAGNFQDWVSADANENTVSAGKIVKGMPVRGGTTSPAGLFWSLDSLIRVSYAPASVGTSTIYWRYDIVTSQSSILSSSSVIEYDGIFYWCGIDRFLMYNGVVTELVNTMNNNYFFDNLNYSQRQKVWASKVPRWGEIWWFYPSGDSEECDNAIIYNVREKIWYDAGFALGAKRSAGVFSEVFRKPIWACSLKNEDNCFNLWQHETGVNRVNLNEESAIQSYFETDSIGWVNGGPGQNDPSGLNNWIRLERVEPDFIQSEDMNLYVTGKGYANAEDVETGPYTFAPDTLKIDLREQRREMRLRFESNIVNGNYECGLNLLLADIGDVRSVGNP
jgi:hypothetical protein